MQRHWGLKDWRWAKGGSNAFAAGAATWLFALVLAALPGCVILPIPTPEHGLLSGLGEITEANMVFLEVGKTTREDVLLRFGGPWASLNDGQILIYHWQTKLGYVIVGTTQGSGAGPIPKDYLVLLEFDEHGFLKRFERTSVGPLELFESAATRVDRWTPPGSVKLAVLRGATKPRVSRGERYVISPVLHAESQPGSALAAIPSLRLKLEDFRDGRGAGKAKWIGRGGFGDIYLVRRVSEVVRDALAAQWEAAGHRLVDDNPDVTVTGQVINFKIGEPVSFFSFAWDDAAGTLDVIIKVRAKGHDAQTIQRRYHSHQVEKTMFRPSNEPYEAVIVACLKDVMHQLASDVDLARYVAGEEIGRSPVR